MKRYVRLYPESVYLHTRSGKDKVIENIRHHLRVLLVGVVENMLFDNKGTVFPKHDGWSFLED